MAQVIQLPIAFEFRPWHSSWRMTKGRVMEWRMISRRHQDEFVLVRPIESSTTVLEVEWPQLPKEWQEIREELRGKPSYLAARLGPRELPLLECRHVGEGKTRGKDDAWVMREEFLRLKQTPDALLEFLSYWGAWKPNVNYQVTTLPVPGQFSLADYPKGKEYQGKEYLVLSRIWQFQDVCRKALVGPANDWLIAAHSMLPPLSSRPEYPHLHWRVGDCERAIRTTITIDLVNKAKFRVCARHDCRTPFKVENRHKHMYCCQYCGHIESIRRQRRKEDQENKQLTKAKRKQS